MSALVQDRPPGPLPAREGNHVSLLVNGCRIFPAMLDAIRAARHSICLETYIYWSGEIGREFAETLASRARAGIDVRVVLDWVGCRPLDQELLDLMTAAGVKIHHFRPLRFYSLHRFNHRSHRKILVVDGSTGFIGGVGIADEWTGDAEDEDHWRDSHYAVKGPVVADLQHAFFAHWDPEDLPASDDERFFPGNAPAGTVRAQLVAADPASGPDRILESFLHHIGAARQRLAIVTPYFVPGESLLQALLAARQRGVEVEVLTCGKKTDRLVVRYASRHRWGELLAQEIRIHEFEPTLLHVKALLVDEAAVIVGSANFDCRSSRINAEANLIVEDREQVRQHWRVFEADRQRSHPVRWSDWKGRSAPQRIKDAMAHLLRDQL